MNIEQRVRGYACEVVSECQFDALTGVSRFESGDRHSVYKVSYAAVSGRTEHVVVRISSDEARAVARAGREARVLEVVAGRSAPVLYDYHEQSRWFEAPTMCLQFIPGRQRAPASVARADIERLGSVVGSLHALCTDDLCGLLGAADILAYRDHRKDRLSSKLSSQRNLLPDPLLDRLERAVRDVERGLADGRRAESFDTRDPLVLLHGDIGVGNIVWSPAPVLIDWEDARLGDPAEEIAYVFGENGLTALQRESFWRGYGQGTSGEDRLERLVDRVGWWEPLTLLGSALAWMQSWASVVDARAARHVGPAESRPPRYYLDQAIRRLNRFDERAAGEHPS